MNIILKHEPNVAENLLDMNEPDITVKCAAYIMVN